MLVSKQGKTYIIAEMSANHCQQYSKAVELVHIAKEIGADAIKVQTYTPDTLTIKCDRPEFHIKDTIWKGHNLYGLYEKAYMPWEWQGDLKKITDKLGLDFISTVYDKTSVDYLESLDITAYKIASFELVDLPFLKYVAKKGKPIILSTGMATLEEILEAVVAIGTINSDLSILKCTSSYPSDAREANINAIQVFRRYFTCPLGLSDHTQGIGVAIASVALGASIIEKHFKFEKDYGSPDESFSLKPSEFKSMVDNIRLAEKALRDNIIGMTENEKESIIFRRSLFAVKDIHKGDKFTKSNIRSIRPGYGLLPKHINEVIGKCSTEDIERGTPLTWDLIR